MDSRQRYITCMNIVVIHTAYECTEKKYIDRIQHSYIQRNIFRITKLPVKYDTVFVTQILFSVELPLMVPG